MLTSKLGCYHKNISKGQKGKLMFAEKGKKIQAKLIFNQSHVKKFSSFEKFSECQHL